MAIDKVRKELHKLIDESENEETLKDFKQKLAKEKRMKAEWDKLSQAAKDGIERGLKDIANGRTHTHEEVMQSIKEEFGF